MIDKLIIERATWSRGNINQPSELINDDGNKCCLGFLGCAIGINENFLRGYSLPKSVSGFSLIENLYNKDKTKSFWSDFLEINDKFSPSEEEREQKLIKLFKEKINIELTFV
jgi:hypothetical protein